MKNHRKIPEEPKIRKALNAGGHAIPRIVISWINGAEYATVEIDTENKVVKSVFCCRSQLPHPG